MSELFLSGSFYDTFSHTKIFASKHYAARGNRWPEGTKLLIITIHIVY